MTTIKQATKILSCTCSHDYQDQRYGARRRVHNRVDKPDVHDGGWRCTVCTKTRDEDRKR